MTETVRLTATVPEGFASRLPYLSLLAPYLPYLVLLGLLLHLLMTLFGAGIPLKQSFSFLWQLFSPFFTPRRYQTIDQQNQPLPFTTLRFNQDVRVSNVLGRFRLPNLPEEINLQLNRPGYLFKTRRLNQKTFQAINYVQLEKKDRLMPLERLQVISLSIRWIPLLIASLSSLVAVIISPDYSNLSYLLTALNLSYSEYLYPRLAK